MQVEVNGWVLMQRKLSKARGSNLNLFLKHLLGGSFGATPSTTILTCTYPRLVERYFIPSRKSLHVLLPFLHSQSHSFSELVVKIM